MELQIIDPTWSDLKLDTIHSWIKEFNDNKEKIIAQFVAESKSSTPVTKNRNLGTVYRMEFDDSGGYESDFITNSVGRFQSNAKFTMFDTTANNNSNGETILEGSDLNVNAVAATKKQRPSILKGKGRKTFKSSEMPTGAVGKMMSNKKIPVMDGDKITGLCSKCVQ